VSSVPGYKIRAGLSGAPYVDLSATATPVQWCLYQRHSNSLTVSGRDIVDDARTRHWSFSEIALPDGAAIRWLNNRQRHLLLKFRDGLKGVCTRTVRTMARPDTVAGTLIGVTARGVPYELTEDGDGFAVFLAPGNSPYIDTAGVPIANDPKDDGWPLPFEVVSITAMKGILPDSTTVPVVVSMEQERTISMPGRQLTAFTSGNRVVPLLHPGMPAATEIWASITHTELSYIALARIRSICCLLLFPAVLVEALVAGLAAFFGTQAKQCPPVDRSDLVKDREKAESELVTFSQDILGEVPTRRVRYMG